MQRNNSETKIISARQILIGLVLLTGAFLTACSSDSVAVLGSAPARQGVPPLPHAYVPEQPDGALLLEENARAGDALAGQLLLRQGSGSGMLAASLVELGNLDQAALFGQVISQQIGSRLSQHGFKVLESRLAAELRLDKANGEFMLTRESAQLLTRNHNASSVLLGVSSEAGQRIYLSVRVVRLNDNAVLAAYEYYLPKTDDILALLAPGGSDRARVRSSHEQIWSGMAARERAFQK
jgi:TolB-like protein